MNMKLIGLCLIAIIATVGIVYAVQQQVWINPQEGEVVPIEIIRYLNNLTVIDDLIDWSPLNPNNTYTYNWTIRNDAESTILVYYESSNLSSGWTLTWTANATILDYQESAVGWLTLTVPLNATYGLHKWEGHTKAEYT